MEIITFNLNKLLSLMLEKSIYWIIEQYMTIGGVEGEMLIVSIKKTMQWLSSKEKFFKDFIHFLIDI